LSSFYFNLIKYISIILFELKNNIFNQNFQKLNKSLDLEGIQYNNMNINPAEMSSVYINSNISGYQNIGILINLALFP